MILTTICKKIDDYLNGKICWKEFGSFYEYLLFKNHNFQGVFPEDLVLLLGEIQSDCEYSDYTESLRRKQPYILYEIDFKKRLKINLVKLNNIIRSKGYIREKLRKIKSSN